MGVGDWFWAPIMHSMSGFSLAWHWHCGCEHVHARSHRSLNPRSQSGTVLSCGWLLRVPALVSVKNFVFLLACSVWVIRWTALLCRAILSPLRYGCSHVDRRWGHVSLSFLWHSVQLGFWYWRGQNICFLWLPMYCAYLNFRVWVICVSGTCLLFQKWLDNFWLICLFDIHLLTYGYFWLADAHSRFSCSFVINVWRLRIALSCVPVGQLANQYGVMRAMCIRGVVSIYLVVFSYWLMCPPFRFH